MERFTLRARRVLSLAQEACEARKQKTINTEHMLLGMMREEGSIAGRVLRDLGVTWQALNAAVDALPVPPYKRSSNKLNAASDARLR